MAVFINNRCFILTILVIAASILNFWGCTRDLGEQSAEERQIVARINNYRMSVADFKNGVGFVLASKYLYVEPNEVKGELLDELITRNVLLQEAQREGLDKERAFMKEIERYWEQSLLKLLLKMRAEELSRIIFVEDSEIIDEYGRMKRKIFAQLVILNSQKAAEKLSSASIDKFDAVKDTVKEKIVSQQPPEWRILGDLPQYLEEPLFSLGAGRISYPIKCGNNWAVIKILKDESAGIEPFKNMAFAIRKSILKRKKEQALEEWIEGLRKNVFIKINKKVLNEINLK